MGTNLIAAHRELALSQAHHKRGSHGKHGGDVRIRQ